MPVSPAGLAHAEAVRCTRHTDFTRLQPSRAAKRHHFKPRQCATKSRTAFRNRQLNIALQRGVEQKIDQSPCEGTTNVSLG